MRVPPEALVNAMGVDPGRWVGWSVLDVGNRAVMADLQRYAGFIVGGVLPRFLAAGVLDLEELGEAAVVEELQALALAHRVTRAGVERVEEVRGREGGFGAARATTLVRAAWLGGTVAQALRGDGVAVRTFAAEEVRRHFVAGVGPAEAAVRRAVDQTADMDEVVATVVRQRVAGWPAKLPGTGGAYRKDGSDLMAERRSHAFDAGLAALYASGLP